MSVLLRSSEITKKPVVTYGGEDVAQIKDVVYGANGGHVEGFTLAGRGLFAGPLKTAIAWSSVVGLGPDAVIIADESSLVPTDAMLESAVASGAAPGGGDVLGSQVLTDDGTALGTVVDVIIEVSKSEQADVVGYEIDPAESLGRGKNRLLIPLPDTLAASGEHLIVPAAARDFVRDDLAGFGAAVEDFRARIKGQ
ncbi:PRC-barrel domain-containing protein [Nakamurella flavida]|uniref:PRC-barrel domain-containing protein n=1 Tax=Nakamurella flavida TaxID=363630 RepID=A0A939C764_9ACTN|nr:PRC-barrel domain-containing protein [Nakamurella flavida]MBM9477842.1 PRC-barrel domain-containing protein [Nakamurella flavida]MDP9779396.1 sporulation protein YlmC with PRC-barrel domain [Nakamurella flavida]